MENLAHNDAYFVYMFSKFKIQIHRPPASTINKACIGLPPNKIQICVDYCPVVVNKHKYKMNSN